MGNLTVKNSGANAYVKALCDDTGASAYLHSDTNGIHGVWSPGYWDGTSFVSDSKRLVYRDTSGNVYC